MTKIEQLIHRVREHFESSPIRNLDAEGVPGSPRRDDLRAVDKEIATLAESVQRRLTVIVMGEVKSGKSSLVNALVGKEVSPTDVLEATAAIIEIEYAPQEHAAICYHDGRQTCGTPSEVFRLLEGNRGDSSFFGTIRVVKLGLPLPRLKNLRIVDTPGLATITEENARTTEQYVQNADVVLWVLNALHVGQIDLIGALGEVAKLGKPVVAVVNRIDQVGGSPDRLVRYLRRELAAYARQVFPLSAWQAYEGVVRGDAELEAASGFTDLAHFLEHDVDRRADEVKDASIASSVAALLRRDSLIHEAYGHEISRLAQLAQSDRDELRAMSERIAARVNAELKERALHEPCQDLLEGASANPKSGSAAVVSDRHLTASAVNWLQTACADAQKRVCEFWQADYQQYSAGLQARLAQVWQRQGSIHLEADTMDIPDTPLQGAIEGMAVAGAGGLALSAYAAWLGPMAASISMVSAISAIMPPVLLAGAVAGYVLREWRKRENQRRRIIALEARVKGLRRGLVERVLEPEVFPRVHELSEKIADHLHGQFVKNLCGGWTEERMTELQEQLEAYALAAGVLEAELTALATTSTTAEAFRPGTSA